jgi:uncharacterized protein YjcR
MYDHDAKTRHEAVKRYVRGQSLAEVAAFVGASPTAVRRWVLAAGHETRPRGRPAR